MGADLSYDEESQTFEWVDSPQAAMLARYNCDCTMPSENHILDQNNCQATISVLFIDYDANLQLIEQTKSLLKTLF